MARNKTPGYETRYDWILEVLSDLKRFSKANGMDSLAAELDNVSAVAAAEISVRLARDVGAPRSSLSTRR